MLVISQNCDYEYEYTFSVYEVGLDLDTIIV